MSFNFQYSGKLNMQEFPKNITEEFKSNPCHFRIQTGANHSTSYFHMHNYLQLWYVLHGFSRHSLNDLCFDQGVGDFLIVPPFFTHRIDTSLSDDIEYIFCELSEGFLNIFPDKEKNALFNLSYLRPLFSNVERKRPFISFSNQVAKQIEFYLFELINEYKKEADKLSPFYFRANIVRLLTLVAHEFELISPQEDDALYANYRMAIQNALDYIDSHYTENIHLNDICKIALMSVSQFSYIFKQITGKTIFEYINYLRIRLAVKLLVNTNKSILNISCECGFFEPEYFCRVFKKTTGYPPSIYRKKSIFKDEH